MFDDGYGDELLLPERPFRHVRTTTLDGSLAHQEPIGQPLPADRLLKK
jgi:hypothetical protein